MPTVVHTLEGKINLYCKGAATVILERLTMSQLYTEKDAISPAGASLQDGVLGMTHTLQMVGINLFFFCLMAWGYHETYDMILSGPGIDL
jgi:hypothetical protein